MRLLTLTGPGGVGKTSLALHAAQALRDSFADGIHFISLAPISDPTLVIPTLAKTLDVNETPDRVLFESLKVFLREQQALLLLDNFEQVITAAPLLAELLASCEQLRLLVTSREALRVRGEQEFSLSPLTLPDLVVLPAQPAVETLMQYPSVALFVQRAQASKPDFRLTPENAVAIAELCARLDGLPLAIELAAARVKLLSPQAMLGRLTPSLTLPRETGVGMLRLLTGGARDLPARQQTLYNTIQWSYDLLTADEQRLFRWLSVFVGGCTLEAAQSIQRSEAETEAQPPTYERGKAYDGQGVLDLLTSLVNKSLVRQGEGDGEPRLNLLEMMREFGLEQLRQSGEYMTARRAHATYMLSFVEGVAPQLAGAEQKLALNRLERELDNLRAALHWLLESHESVLALRLANVLSRFWFMRGYWHEGRRWMEEVIADCQWQIADWKSEVVPSSEGPSNGTKLMLYAKLMREAGALIRYQGDFARARTLCEQSVALYRELNDPVGMLSALVQICRLISDQGDWAAARTKVEEVLPLAAAVNDPRAKAEAYFITGTNALVEADLTNAQARLTESLRWMRQLGDKAGTASALNGLSLVAIGVGDYATAQSLSGESFKLAQEVGDKRSGGRALFSRARLAYKQGRYAEARTHFETLWTMLFSTHDFNVVWTLEGLAMVYLAQGLPQWAVRLFSRADVVCETYRIPHMPLFQTDLDENLAKTRAVLGAEAFAAAWAEGRTLPLEDALKAPQPAPASPHPELLEPLTVRELEILQLLAQDFNAPQIAERLVVSPRTVHAHTRAIYDKLGVKSRESAVRVAVERKLIRDLPAPQNK